MLKTCTNGPQYLSRDEFCNLTLRLQQITSSKSETPADSELISKENAVKFLSEGCHYSDSDIENCLSTIVTPENAQPSYALQIIQEQRTQLGLPVNTSSRIVENEKTNKMVFAELEHRLKEDIRNAAVRGYDEIAYCEHSSEKLNYGNCMVETLKSFKPNFSGSSYKRETKIKYVVKKERIGFFKSRSTEVPVEIPTNRINIESINSPALKSFIRYAESLGVSVQVCQSCNEYLSNEITIKIMLPRIQKEFGVEKKAQQVNSPVNCVPDSCGEHRIVRTLST